jgi:RNA polymerase sigma-70 factor, ECF subfamily
MATHDLDRSDVLLVDDMRRGSSAALAALFDRHADAVYTYCFRRTASWHTAEDATSTVFLEYWRGRTRAKVIDDSALPWLYGIARNVCRSADRSARRLTRALQRVPQEVAAAGDEMADGVVRRVDSEERMASVLEAIAGLPERERDVLELVVWAGESYEATAAALRIPVGTVRSRLSRARQRLSLSVDDPIA